MGWLRGGRGGGDLGVEAGVPAYVEGDSSGEGGEEESWPGLHADEEEGREVDGGDIGEEKDLVVAAGGEEDGGEEGSGEGVGGEELGVLGPGHEGVPGGDEDHGSERGGGGEEVIEVEGSPEGEIEDAGADGFERPGERREALAAEALGPEDETQTDPQTNQDAGDGAEPALLDGELEGPAGGEEEGDDADAVEDLGAEAVFERLGGFGGGGGLHWLDGVCVSGDETLQWSGERTGRRGCRAGLPRTGRGRADLRERIVLGNSFREQGILQEGHLAFEVVDAREQGCEELGCRFRRRVGWRARAPGEVRVHGGTLPRGW